MTSCMATGISREPDSRLAAESAFSMASKKLTSPSIQLVILFCSSHHDYGIVLDSINRLSGEVPLVGMSTYGEFTEQAVKQGSVAITLLSSDSMLFFTGLAENIYQDPETAVSSIITNIHLEDSQYPHRCIFLLADGMQGNMEEITLLVASMAGYNTQIIGGIAADDFQMKRTVVFHNQQITDKAASICVMMSKTPFFSAVCHGHRPLTPAMHITRAERNILYEIEGRPAWEVWREKTRDAAKTLGLDVDTVLDKGPLAAYFSNFELGLRIYGDTYKVRYPLSVNEQGAISFTCAIPEQAMISIMDGRQTELQIQAARQAAEEVTTEARQAGYQHFAGALVVECAVRQFLLGKQFYRAPEALKDVLGNIPMAGAETYGEFCMKPGEYSGYHNTSTVVLLLVQ